MANDGEQDELQARLVEELSKLSPQQLLDILLACQCVSKHDISMPESDEDFAMILAQAKMLQAAGLL